MNEIKQDGNRYADILDMERPRHIQDDFSKRHPPMPLQERAKIFLPFAALKGYEQKVEERETVFDRENGVSEDLLQDLNDTMLSIKHRIALGETPIIRVRYFMKTENRDNGDGHERWKEGLCGAVDGVRQTIEVGEENISFSALREIQVID